MSEDLTEINNILQSGALAYGKYGQEFETMLNEYLGVSKSLVVNSYNAAMLLVITVLDIKQGDEVIASPMSCLASNQPFATMGVNVVWADILPSKGTLDPGDVRQKITKKTKAIFHNHYCGYLGDIEAINNIGKEFGIPVVDDGIEGFGSEYKAAKLGNVGTDITVFSYETIRMPNSVSGGGVVFKHEKHFEKARRVRDYGVDRSTFRDEIGEINVKSDIKTPGYGLKANELNSYIGLQNLSKTPSLLAIQAENAKKWKSYFKKSDLRVKPVAIDEKVIPNYWVYGLLAENKKAFIIEMRERGFYASGVHVSNHNYSVFGKKISLKGVEEFSSKFVAVPSGWWFKMSDDRA